jgi:alpha-L-fucosidase 2
VPTLSVPLVITLLPALPSQWAAQGHLRGVRVRGGITVDLYWENGRPTSALFVVDGDENGRKVADRQVVVMYNGVVVADFMTSPGLSEMVNRFGYVKRFRGQSINDY